MIDKSKCPHFIPDKPTGEDVFDGQSQTYLADTICEHMKSVDAIPDPSVDAIPDPNGIQFPRIIGLEGTWGSGKSNVIKKVANKLSSKGYYTFTYDAWGHQEDLQRRSILETLTNELINEKVLEGEVTIQLRNGKPHTAKWPDQLVLLLSNKSTTYTCSQPHLSGPAIWGIVLVALFTLLCVITGQLNYKYPDICFSWLLLIDLVPIILGIIIFLIYCLNNHELSDLTKFITRKEDNTTDVQYTSSEEPSVMEFKNWISAISKYLSKTKKRTKKVIIVFDNMDRLPSGKVMQLWSAIYTFFAGSEFENIWTIIPYDYMHLCEAITGNSLYDKDGKRTNDADRIKRFINKTFPIVYTVPQPVITDYRKLFNVFFEKAFGKTEHDQEHICQVFMKLETNPNPRTVISFVNELVSLRLQWPNNKYRLQNLALYILKKNKLFYNSNSLDKNLLDDSLFDDVLPFYPNEDIIRTQLCQFAFGLEDEVLAQELPLRRILQQSIKNGESIVTFANSPNFVRILNDVLSKDVDKLSVDTAIQSLNSLGGYEFSDADKESLKKKWDMLTNLKVESGFPSLEFKLELDKTLPIIINHASDKRISTIVQVFCQNVQRFNIQSGTDYFNTLHSLKECLNKANKIDNIKAYLKEEITTPQHFVEFVIAAKDDYDYYQLKVKGTELNEYLYNLIENGKEESAMVMKYISNDKSYNFKTLQCSLSEAIKTDKITNKIRIAAYVNRLLDGESNQIKNRFKNPAVTANIRALDLASDEILNVGNEDLFAMYLADGSDISAFEKKMVPRLAECFEKYYSYTELVKRRGSTGSALQLLNKYIIENKKFKKEVDLRYIAQNIVDIKSGLQLDYSVIFSYFNHLGKVHLNESDSIDEFFKQEIFEEYKKYPGDFTNSIILLGVQAMEKRPKGFLIVNSGASINAYWSSFIMSYLGTSYLPKMTSSLTIELTILLDYICSGKVNEHAEILEKLLDNDPDKAILTEYLNDKVNSYFVTNNAVVAVFKVFAKLLPRLGKSMNDITARGLITHFIKPVYFIPECAQIIVDQKDFYLNVLKHDITLAQEIINGMKTNEDVKEIYSPIKDELIAFTVEEEKSEN